MSIIIGGDLVPTESNEKIFINGNKRELLGDELSAILEDAEYRIFNLETPLVDEYTPITKAGPALMANTNTVAGIKKIGVDLLTLANNHILDQGEIGLESTRQILEEHDISYVGVGENATNAAKPFFFEQKGKRVGVFACAEHEFSIAGESTAGAYGFDPIDSFDLINDASRDCDYLIVLYHGGKEYYRYPSPYLRKICRKMVDNGAALVICQHSHCVGCEEKYNSSTIVYGQGNFLFDKRHDEFWNSGLLVKINDEENIEYIPITQNGTTIKMANSDEAEAILRGFAERSAEITEPGFVESRYNKFADELSEYYLFAFSGIKRTFLYRVVNKISRYKYEKWLLNKKYNMQNLAIVENFIECEAHNELVVRGLKNRIKKQNIIE